MDPHSAPPRASDDAAIGAPACRPSIRGASGAPGDRRDDASAPGIAFVCPAPSRAAATLSARMRADAWRALAARVTPAGGGGPGPVEVVDDLGRALSPGREVVVLEASAAAGAPELVRRAGARLRIVLVTDADGAARSARLALDLDARCVAPSAHARNALAAELARHVPTWEALARTAVVHDAIPDGLGASRSTGGARPLVTHWAAARDLDAVLAAFRAARALRPSLALRVLMDPAAAPRSGLPEVRAEGVEVAAVRSPADAARELARSSGLYHPLERWPDASIAGAALAGAVGAPAFVSARCAGAEAVLRRGELLSSAAPGALLTALAATADPAQGPREAPVTFSETDVALRWLEELSAAVRA